MNQINLPRTKEIQRVLVEKGPDALPVTLVDGQIVKVGSYPSNEEFAAWFEVKPEELTEKPVSRLTIDLKQL